jgi:L-lactate utilization protein LutB
MEKTDKEQKSIMIKAIAEVIDKNTRSTHDVWSVLHAIQDSCAFAEDKRYKYRNDLPYCIRSIREKLEEHGIKMLFDDISDDLQEVIMLAGENAEGLLLVNSESMKKALNEISDQYNS